MPASPFHKDRITEQLRREIGMVIQSEVRDPRIPSLITIASVKLSDDMHNATVRISVFGDEPLLEGAISALNHAAPFIQKVVATHVKMKNFPRLLFVADTGVSHGQRIDQLLKEIKDDLV